MSLREEIDSRRKLAVKRIILNAPILGIGTAGAAGLLPGPWWAWAALTAYQTLCIAANAYEIWNMRQALRIYDSSPLVGYLAEIRHAFPASTTADSR